MHTTRYDTTVIEILRAGREIPYQTIIFLRKLQAADTSNFDKYEVIIASLRDIDDCVSSVYQSNPLARY